MNGQEPSQETKRMLELLCNIGHKLSAIGDKLDDLNTLTQQQSDLIRRILKERVQ